MKRHKHSAECVIAVNTTCLLIVDNYRARQRKMHTFLNTCASERQTNRQTNTFFLKRKEKKVIKKPRRFNEKNSKYSPKEEEDEQHSFMLSLRARACQRKNICGCTPVRKLELTYVLGY